MDITFHNVQSARAEKPRKIKRDAGTPFYVMRISIEYREPSGAVRTQEIALYADDRESLNLRAKK